jgi:molybdopterin molybdotransferase
VTFCLVARPFLLQLQGVEEVTAPQFFARAAFSVSRAGKRREYLRVKLQQDGSGLSVVRYSNQSSGVLSSVSHSNALAVIPEGATVAEGDSVEVLLLDSLV